MENKSGKRRRNKWDQSGEKAILQIWSEKVDKLRACKKNLHIIIEIVAEMESMDYYYTLREIKTKMQNMIARYRKERKQIKSGMPSIWEHYEEMHSIMTRFEFNNSDILENRRSFTADKNNAENTEQKWKIEDPMSLLVPQKSKINSQCDSESLSSDSDIKTQSEHDDDDPIVNLDENISFFPFTEKSKDCKNPLLLPTCLEKHNNSQTDDNGRTRNLDNNISLFSAPEQSRNDKNPLLARTALKKYKRPRPYVEWEKSDDIDLFFFSMSKTVKKLPYCEQVQLKKEISNLIFQAELKCIPAEKIK